MARFLQRYGRGRPAGPRASLERAILELLEPAAQRSATDLFVLTHGRANTTGTKQEFYEVTLVQFLYQYLLMSPQLRSHEIHWEVPYGLAGTNPKRVDLTLATDDGSLLLLEAGRYTVQKLKEDSEKLRSLRSPAGPVAGEKRVLLYWIGPDAPSTAGETRAAIRRPMANARSSTRVGPRFIRPLWVMGCELHAQAPGRLTQFSAIMVEVLP